MNYIYIMREQILHLNKPMVIVDLTASVKVIYFVGAV